jgi:hypothetical protein
LVATVAHAGEFRTLQPILTPQQLGVTGVQTGKLLKPVPRDTVVGAVKEVLSAWNENRIDGVLDNKFFDRSQMEDAMQSKVPRDARLTPQSIGDIQTIKREIVDTPEGRMARSTVMVTVKTQLTFNDPQKGYQRRNGVNTYVLTITEPEENED